jgi:S-adenosylmethionine:diacylglycerol 3-amino-3-carboxypropyl transferase
VSDLAATPWVAGRFDARAGPRRVLFGRMYEDASVELSAFRPGGRVFCIASAGCTAVQLASRHDVVAIEINPRQLAYAARRLEGAPAARGTAERVIGFMRAFAPLVGWTRARVERFVALDDPAAQRRFWQRELDTRRLRVAFDAAFSVTALRSVYAVPLLQLLPRRFGAVMRGRLERGFGRHPNRTNPYARALLLGELPAVARPAGRVTLVQSDAAAWLERIPQGSFDGFTLSNILDGASPEYRARLFDAVKRAAAADAVVVLRSFAEPVGPSPWNRAADDRAMLWGVVDVRPVAELEP